MTPLYLAPEQELTDEDAQAVICAICGDPLPYKGARCPNDCSDDY